MSKKPEAKISGNLVINAQYIKDLSFENPKAPYSFMYEEKPEIDVSIDIGARNIQDDTYEVVLGVQVRSEIQGEIQFLIDLKYAGVVSLEPEQEDRDKVIFVECPNIIFPYVRRIISDVTRDGGYLPLYISPIDFYGLYVDNKNKAEC
ncbi:protein-export chaperone SecB [Candidatus Bandiella euplotis]|uniref:Protein-export protein SecB n=1 Tax=Candidatus Bandiella euplotis TaxID=1664265 RepID=A0ABZ0UKS0_9RICK|nr:protein-export chaperone SecB [Candidatus Bandiella woodruffii]WPX96729.1 Protein-export protein SecB [Candidatus Bandiella woodruffii]